MTTFERFEREMPELMTELSPARVPDYFDDMLEQTARTRQRPAWASLERWIPMGVLARTQPMRPLPWRAIVILATLAILLAALVGAALIVGSTPRLPEPFGLAGNGSIVFSTADGQIVTADPRTGATTTLIDSPELDSNPWFSNDGTRFAFDRRTPGSPAALFVANADGTDLHQVAGPGPEITWFDWSPTGDRFALSRNGDPSGQVTIMDAADGSTTTFQLELQIANAVWRPNSDQLVITTQGVTPAGSAEQGFYLVRSDGTGLKPIVVGPSCHQHPDPLAGWLEARLFHMGDRHRRGADPYHRYRYGDRGRRRFRPRLRIHRPESDLLARRKARSWCIVPRRMAIGLPSCRSTARARRCRWVRRTPI